MEQSAQEIEIQPVQCSEANHRMDVDYFKQHFVDVVAHPVLLSEMQEFDTEMEEKGFGNQTEDGHIGRQLQTSSEKKENKI